MTGNGEVVLYRIEAQHVKRSLVHGLTAELKVGGEAISIQVVSRKVISLVSNIKCKLPIEVDVQIQRRCNTFTRLIAKEGDLANFRTVITDIDNGTVILYDPKKILQLKLIFTKSHSSTSLQSHPPQIQSVVSNLSIAKAIASDDNVLLDKLGKAKGILKFMVKAGGAIAEISPFAKLAFVAVDALYSTCEAQETCRDAVIEMLDELDMFVTINEELHGSLESRKLSKQAVVTMVLLVKNISDYICENTKKHSFGNILSLEHRTRVAEFKKQFERAMKQFSANIQVETLQTVLDQLHYNMLQELRPVFDAHFNPEEGCLEGTRVELLTNLIRWIQGACDIEESVPAIYSDMESKSAVWVCGLAGSGKSTLVNSVATLAEQQGLSISSFCCKRDKKDSWCSVERLFLMLAYQIAKHNVEYRNHIVGMLQGPNQIKVLKGVYDVQIDELFTRPLSQITPPLLPYVIVVDALDECAGQQVKVVEAIQSIAKVAPWIKIIITSRDEELIRGAFDNIADVCHRIDINYVQDTEKDIENYTTFNLLKLDLDVEQAEVLTKMAGGLFIWSSTIFKFLEGNHNREVELQKLTREKSPTKPLKRLYALYDTILQAASSDDDADSETVLRRVLAIILISSSTTPLPISAIVSFLQRDAAFSEENEKSVGRILRALHPVMYEDVNNGKAVRVYHPSFLDYLSTKMCSIGWDSPRTIHKLMFDGSCAVLLEKLRFNICRLGNASDKDNEVEGLDLRITTFIPMVLQYACQHWFFHLQQNEIRPSDSKPYDPVFALLCSKRIFYWLEVLNITGNLKRGIDTLQKCIEFFEGMTEITQICEDTFRFVSSFSQAMDSTPHIYTSALCWLPTNSPLRRLTETSFRSARLLLGGLSQDWDASLWTSQFEDTVNFIAYSPDGQLIAACVENDVYLLDSVTGQHAQEPLRGHTYTVKCVAFSPDGARLASGSYDSTIRIWELATGREMTSLEGHTSRVTSLAFSPNGNYLVSGSVDKSVRIWSCTDTGNVHEQFILLDHEDSVNCVAISPDSSLIASTSWDKTVRLWNAANGDVLKILRGHNNGVHPVYFTPDGKSIVTGGADSVLRVWNSETGEFRGMTMEGHTDWITCLSCSTDGKYLASGSADGTIRIWDCLSGKILGMPPHGRLAEITSVTFTPDNSCIVFASGSIIRSRQFGVYDNMGEFSHGHSSSITSVVFSQDSTRVISSSWDETIRVWDSLTGSNIGAPLLGHKDAVTSVSISPDNTRIASGSYDGDVRIWNLHTGEAIGEPLQGHSGTINSVVFSLDGKSILSGSEDCSVRIWPDMCKGPIYIHEGKVNALAVAPNGIHIVSGTSENRIHIWNLQTDAEASKPLQGHDGIITSVAVSSDSKWIVSGSWDKTVRLWDLESGDAICEPILRHTAAVTAVAFSPDGTQFASASYDGTVRLWDTKTKNAAGYPLKAHTGAVGTIAFSHDGSRIVSGSMDKNIFISTIKDSEEDQWKQNSRCMDLANGWIKDDERLLFWVPQYYRHWFRGNVDVWIRDGLYEWERVPPKVDLKLLDEIAGDNWEAVYEEHTTD